MAKWIILGIVVLVVIGAAIISECYEDGWAAGYCEGMRKAEEIRKKGSDENVCKKSN